MDLFASLTATLQHVSMSASAQVMTCTWATLVVKAHTWLPQVTGATKPISGGAFKRLFFVFLQVRPCHALNTHFQRPVHAAAGSDVPAAAAQTLKDGCALQALYMLASSHACCGCLNFIHTVNCSTHFVFNSTAFTIRIPCTSVHACTLLVYRPSNMACSHYYAPKGFRIRIPHLRLLWYINRNKHVPTFHL